MSGDWINYALFITKEIAEAVKKSSDDTKEAEAVKPEDNILQKFGIWDIYSAVNNNPDSVVAEAVVPETLENVVEDIRHNTYQKAGDLALDIQQLKNQKPTFGLGGIGEAGAAANTSEKMLAQAELIMNSASNSFSESEEKNEESQELQTSAEGLLTDSETSTRSADERTNEAENESKEADQKASEADIKNQEAETKTDDASSKRQESEQLNSEAETEITSADTEISDADTEIANADTIISNANSVTPETEAEAAVISKQKIEAEQAKAEAVEKKENAESKKTEAQKKQTEAEELSQEAESLENDAAELKNEAEGLNEEAEAKKEHSEELNTEADDFREEAKTLQTKGNAEKTKAQELQQEAENLNNEAVNTQRAAEQTEEKAGEIKEEAQAQANDAIDREFNNNVNGQIEATKQGRSGDCWLLSDINSMSQTEWGKQAISDAVKSDGAGGANVTFKGAAKGEQNSYNISAEELEDAKASGKYSSGDDDMLALELATEKYLTKYKDKYDRNHPGGVLESMDGFSMENLLTPNVRTHSYNYVYDSFDKPLEAVENSPSKYSVNCGFKSNQKAYGMYQNHAYALTGISTDPATGKKYAEVVNPWDSSKKIKIPYNEFKQNLSILNVTEPPGENNQNLSSFGDELDKLNKMVNSLNI